MQLLKHIRYHHINMTNYKHLLNLHQVNITLSRKITQDDIESDSPCHAEFKELEKQMESKREFQIKYQE